MLQFTVKIRWFSFLIILNVISSNTKRITIVSRKRIKILENTKFTILSWNDDPIFRGFQNECSIKCTYSKRQCHPEGNQINAVRKKKNQQMSKTPSSPITWHDNRHRSVNFSISVKTWLSINIFFWSTSTPPLKQKR